MSGGGKRAVGTTSSVSIPSGSKKMVHSIKEIVNCSEMEIYSMLKECNMDPSEAVHRLLSQDTFHEVKSKREKKKETKDIPESRSRAVNNSSNRGPRVAAERGGRINSTQISPNDYGVVHGKLAQHTIPTSSIVVSKTAGSNLNRKSPISCEVVSMENTTEASGGVSLPSQPSSGFQNSWSRAPGQMSMADIVKMGRPQVKPFRTPTVASDMFHPVHDPYMTNVSQHSTKCAPTVIPPLESDPDFHTSRGPVSQDDDIKHDLGTGQHTSHDGWSLNDTMPAESGSDYPQTANVSSIYADPSTSPVLLADEANSHLGSHMSENQVIEEHVNGDSLPTESIRAASLSDRVLEVDNFGHSSHLEDGMLSGINSYHTQIHAFEHHEVGDTDEEISAAAENLQQLNIHKGELGVPSAEDNPAVIIPSHLQVTNADCSHLSFGSFGSGMGATYSGSFPSNSLTSNIEAAPVVEDTPSFDQSHSRTTECFDNDQLESSLNENMASRNSPSSHDLPSASQPETVRDTLDAAHGIEGNFPSVSGYGYSATTQQPAAVYAYPESNSQMPNLSPFSSLMQPFTDSLPSSLLAQTVQPLRELDHPFSALLTTQSVPLKYNTATSSISAPTISIPEVQSEVYSTPQSTIQNLPSANIPAGGGPALPQHLPLHPYSQPTLPLGHFANMISYPFLPQSYTFLPTAAFQQAYAGGGPFHQSPAAAGMKYTLPQYKSSVPATSLPQAPALPPGYGGFSSSTNNIPGSYSLNPSTAASTTPGIEEAMSSLYKEGSHYLPLQQSENSAMWLHGAGSRAVSALPASTFYGFQGQQSQHNGGYRQVQQQASPYGPMGYMNFYQSQGGPTQEQHQQNPSEGNLSGPQGPASHQMWQHGY